MKSFYKQTARAGLPFPVRAFFCGNLGFDFFVDNVDQL